MKYLLKILPVLGGIMIGYLISELNHRERNLPEMAVGSDSSEAPLLKVTRGISPRHSSQSEVVETGREDQGASVKFIPEVYRQRADALLNLLSLDEQAAGLEGVGGLFDESSKETALKEVLVIAQRLRLDERQQKRFEKLVADNFDRQKNFYESSFLSYDQKISAFTREKLVDHLALELLQEAETLSEEQQSYFDELDSKIGAYEDEHLESLDLVAGESEPWKTNAELLSQFEGFLDASQRQELSSFLREEEERETADVVFYRTQELSSLLGLSNSERDDLRNFLQDYPDASREDISEILDPDLAELLLEQ